MRRVVQSVTRHHHLHCCRLGDHPQIVGDYAPPDPAFHPLVAMIAAASEALTPFQPLIRPSIPARQLRPRRNQRCRLYAIRSADFAPLAGSTTCLIPCVCA
jgi:hypothetical protein